MLNLKSLTKCHSEFKTKYQNTQKIYRKLESYKVFVWNKKLKKIIKNHDKQQYTVKTKNRK